MWYRDTLRNGTNNPLGTSGWAAGSGSQIGAGWDIFKHVFSGADGIIYAIKDTGELLWFRDVVRNGADGPNGTAGWATGSGNQIGAGWHDFPAVFAPGASDGIVYATTQTSDLRWYRDVAYEVAHDQLYPARCGYVVSDPGHKLLAGTNLALGDVVGAQDRNGGGACGWEVDTAVDFGQGNGSARAELDIFAHGELATPEGYTGHMTYYENDAGGFVFAIGSITAGGSVPVDPRLQRIVRNALDACLAETVAPVAVPV